MAKLELLNLGKTRTPMLKASLTLVLLACASTASLADPCEPIRARIEAQIRDAGVASFTVTAVDLDAAVPGEVVGSCDNGSKKIMYAKGDAGASPKPQAAAPVSRLPPKPAGPVLRQPANPTPTHQILTECKDGSVSMGGSCPR
jgi:hypothetical protein